MGEVERVALWVGLIASVAGIVLSIVAIWFAREVDTRSAAITKQTIQSLQKIESTVERQSKDTQELIKAAWDAMLGGMGQPQTPAPSSPAQAGATQRLASGL